MAKKQATKETEDLGINDLVGDLLTEMNKHTMGAPAYVQDDHAKHTWGLPIPFLAAQYLFASSIIPCQRYLGISGPEKSFKSTMMIEIGNWHILQGGLHIHLDTENKTSVTMLDSMSWWNGVNTRCRIFKVCSNIGEWQTLITKAVENARKRGNYPKGKRMPIFITVDSLTGRATEDENKDLRKEGAAAERAFPVGAAQITKFLETLDLLGTTVTVGWVQHRKASIDATGRGPKEKDKGPSASQFSCSSHLSVAKNHTPSRWAGHASAPFDGAMVEGHDLYFRTERSCLGPGGHRLTVPLLWQHVPQEDGSTRQAMWFDWDGALGELLIDMKYNSKSPAKLFDPDKKRLNDLLMFTQLTGKRVKCDELGLEKATFSEFGRAIRKNVEVEDRLRAFLNIPELQSVQEADIDFSVRAELKDK